MNTELQIRIQVAPGVEVVACIAAVEESAIPTPFEHDTQREPTVSELHTFIGKLRAGEFEIIK